MEFLKIISDGSNIEIIPLNKIFSIKVVMGKLHINGENKHLKVEKAEEFLDTYVGIATKEIPRTFCLCIKNENGYARMLVDDLKL